MIVLTIVMSGMSLFASAQNKQDIFADFAGMQHQKVPGLQKNAAPLLPNLLLPWAATPGKTFAASRSIQTQKQLDIELKRMRKRYAPFLANLAPKLPDLRKRVTLDTFRWKLLATEMAVDEKGNLYPLPAVKNVADSTSWRTVNIPHYEGPINKAEAMYKRDLLISKGQMAAPGLFLHFNAVDYIARIFVNGKFVGDHTGLFGAFEFDIKPFVHAGKNSLEIRVYNDAIMMGDNWFLGPNRKFGKKIAACGGPGWGKSDFGLGWKSCPPGFGIWQDCYLEQRSAVYINNLFIQPMLERSEAEVSVEVPAAAKNIDIVYSLYGQNFKATLVSEKKNQTFINQCTSRNKQV